MDGQPPANPYSDSTPLSGIDITVPNWAPAENRRWPIVLDTPPDKRRWNGRVVVVCYRVHGRNTEPFGFPATPVSTHRDIQSPAHRDRFQSGSWPDLSSDPADNALDQFALWRMFARKTQNALNGLNPAKWAKNVVGRTPNVPKRFALPAKARRRVRSVGRKGNSAPQPHTRRRNLNVVCTNPLQTVRFRRPRRSFVGPTTLTDTSYKTVYSYCNSSCACGPVLFNFILFNKETHKNCAT